MGTSNKLKFELAKAQSREPMNVIRLTYRAWTRMGGPKAPELPNSHLSLQDDFPIAIQMESLQFAFYTMSILASPKKLRPRVVRAEIHNVGLEEESDGDSRRDAPYRPLL